MAKRAKRPETFSGSFSALPHAVMDSRAYTGATSTAKALLNELLRQVNGVNNGHLHLADKWMAKRGWPSKSTVDKYAVELIERDLVVQTKQGGMGIGASWFALTWLPVSNFVGLDIGPGSYRKGAWTLCALPPTPRRKPPKKKCDAQPDHRGGPDPTIGASTPSLDPTTGSRKPTFGISPDPYTGDDVCNQCPPAFDSLICKGWKFHGWHEPRPAMVSIFRH
jgi:hypothetical protein